MGEIRYLILDELVALHDEAIARCGGFPSTLIDPHKLDSALNRPRHAAWYENADLIRHAVLLAVAVSQSQAFLDGNKRAAFAAFDVFLILNGVIYSGESLPLARWIEAIAEADRSQRDAMTDEFEGWLREFITKDSLSE